MEIAIEQAIQRAVAAHERGDLNEAELLYRAVLRSQPKQPDANHNLGVIAVSLNQIEAAVVLFETALDTNPKIEQFWLSYVDALVKAERPKDAKRAIKQAKKKGGRGKKIAQAIRSIKKPY